MIQDWFKKNILDSGTSPQNSPGKNLALRSYNSGFFLALLVLVAYFFSDRGESAIILATANLIVILSSIVSFYLVRYRHDWIGRILFIVGINVLVFLGIDQTGVTSSERVFYLITAVVPFMFFERHYQRTIYALALLPAILYFIPVLYGTNIFLQEMIHEPQLIKRSENSFFVAYIVFFVSFTYFTYIYDQSQKQLQMARSRLAHKMQMTAIGEMAKGMAHEINNPLSVIAGKIQIIEMDLHKGVPSYQKLKEYFESMNRASVRIAQIVRSLASFAKDIETEESELVNLRDLTLATLNLCQQRFVRSHVVVRTEKIESIECMCHPGKLQQAVYNLLMNAFQAAQDQNEKWIEISVSRSESYCEIAVTDSGFGIPAGLREKIFQPFFTTRSVGEGAGLGLSTAKGLVEIQGGRLALDTKSKHTRFTIQLL